MKMKLNKEEEAVKASSSYLKKSSFPSDSGVPVVPIRRWELDEGCQWSEMIH
jgi:hypothetical protein